MYLCIIELEHVFLYLYPVMISLLIDTQIDTQTCQT